MKTTMAAPKEFSKDDTIASVIAELKSAFHQRTDGLFNHILSQSMFASPSQTVFRATSQMALCNKPSGMSGYLAEQRPILTLIC